MLILAIASFCFVPPAKAHLPEVFGRKYIRAGLTSHALTDYPGETAQTVDLDRQEDQIEAAERAGGPYADGLTDPLITLAALHGGRGNLDEAIESYRRALHLVRINDGLYSERQVPILRNLMDIYRAQGDPAALGDLYQYYGRILKWGEAPRDLQRIEDALEYLRWEQELYLTRADGLQRIHLLRAYRANAAALDALVPGTAREKALYIELVLSQMRNLYLILGDDPLSILVGDESSVAPEAIRAERGIASIQKVALGKGRELLEQCIEMAADAPPQARARLYLELGDWYQWNDQLARAKRHYMRVVALLREAGDEELLARWLEQPVELPDERDLWAAYQSPGVDGAAVVEASYAVSSQGIARGVRVSVSDEVYDGHARRIKRMLQDTHFRPRYDGEGPQPAERITRHYRLVHFP